MSEHLSSFGEFFHLLLGKWPRSSQRHNSTHTSKKCAAKTAKPAYLPSRRDTLSVSRLWTTRNQRMLWKQLLVTNSEKSTTSSKKLAVPDPLRMKFTLVLTMIGRKNSIPFSTMSKVWVHVISFGHGVETPRDQLLKTRRLISFVIWVMPQPAIMTLSGLQMWSSIYHLL